MTAEYDAEIRLKDLFGFFLRRWKSILAVTVICGLVLGGWQYFSVKKTHDAGEKTKEESRYEQELVLYETNLASAQENLDYSLGVRDRRVAYRDHSLLIGLDPENAWAAEKKYLVSDVSGSAEEILAVYTGAMTADHEEAALLDAFGTDNAGYALEVVSIVADPSENSFTVTVWASEKEKAEKGLAYVSRIIEQTEKTAQGVGAHTLKAVNEGTAKSLVPDLITVQSAIGEQVIDAEDAVNRARRAINNVLESKPFNPGDPVVRWAVTGAVLGFLVMLGIYLTSFLRKRSPRNGAGSR